MTGSPGTRTSQRCQESQGQHARRCEVGDGKGGSRRREGLPLQKGTEGLLQTPAQAVRWRSHGPRQELSERNSEEKLGCVLYPTLVIQNII